MHRAYLAKINNHKNLIVWGSGIPTREFLYVDDLAEACIFLLDNYSSSEHINIGTGIEVSINVLVKMVCEIVGYEGEIVFDHSKPDGHPRKVSNISKMQKLGWNSKIDLYAGLKLSFEWFLKNYNTVRK